jgi:hypothetical protein
MSGDQIFDVAPTTANIAMSISPKRARLATVARLQTRHRDGYVDIVRSMTTLGSEYRSAHATLAVDCFFKDLDPPIL